MRCAPPDHQMALITSEFRAEDAGSIPGVVYRYGVPANEQNAVMATLTVRRVSLAVFVRPRFTDLFAVLLTTPSPRAFVFSLWRTLSVRILTDEYGDCRSARILADSVLQRDNKRAGASYCPLTQ